MTEYFFAKDIQLTQTDQSWQFLFDYLLKSDESVVLPATLISTSYERASIGQETREAR